MRAGETNEYRPRSNQQQFQLIAPTYSWDVRIDDIPYSSDPSSSSTEGSGWRFARTGLEDDFAFVNAHHNERTASHLIEALLHRVRNVGEAIVAPDSVHSSIKKMDKRKSLTPPFWLLPLSSGDSNGLTKRAKQTLLSRAPAPATIDEAIGLAGVSGPRADIHLPNALHSTMSIGTGASGGPPEMNAVPLQEPFSVYLPPPFRVLFLIALGLLCWSANLRGLRKLGLDADGMVSSDSKIRGLPQHRSRDETFSPTTSNTHSAASSRTAVAGSPESDVGQYLGQPGPQETASLRLGLLCLVWGTVCWIAYRIYAFNSLLYGPVHAGGFAHARGRHAQALQGIAILGVVAVAFWPGNMFYLTQRKALGRLFLKICTPSLQQHIHFAHLIFADILTSFARVLGDFWLIMCFLWPGSDSPAWWDGKGSVAVPLLVSLPYLIRFRQCVSEYNVSHTKSLKPLYNAAKYFSAFPVIWLSVLQATSPGQDGSTRQSIYFSLWMVSVFVNSLYSFWWDVTNDWGLEMFTWEAWSATPSLVAEGVRSLHKRGISTMPRLTNQSIAKHRSPINDLPSSHGGNRLAVSNSANGHVRKESHFLRGPQHVMFFPPLVYQLAVTCDLLLRFAWSLKLSNHLHHIIELESTAFYLEALEILRRWVWTYLRIEWEACKRRSWEAEASTESISLATFRSDHTRDLSQHLD